MIDDALAVKVLKAFRFQIQKLLEHSFLPGSLLADVFERLGSGFEALSRTN